MKNNRTNTVNLLKLVLAVVTLVAISTNAEAQHYQTGPVITYGQPQTYGTVVQPPAYQPVQTYQHGRLVHQGQVYQTPGYNVPTYQQPSYQQGVQSYQPIPQTTYKPAIQPTLNNSQPYGSNAATVSSTPSTQSHVPSYQGPGVAVGGTKTHQGVDYSSNAGIGFDQRTDHFVGGTYDGEKFIGAGASAGAGLYGDAGVSQSGKIGNVEVRNYAQGETFVGSEVDGRIGVTKKGATVGAGAFTGGRVSGTIGTDLGPVGYGATGEAWSGAGVEAGLNAGFNDGVLTFGGEAGIGLGVGGKLGVQGSVDVGAIGDGIVDVGQDVGQWGKRTGQKIGNGVRDVSQDVGQWGKKTGQNIGNGVKNVSSNVGNGVKKFGSNVGKETKKISKHVGKGFKKAGNGFKKLFKK